MNAEEKVLKALEEDPTNWGGLWVKTGLHPATLNMAIAALSDEKRIREVPTETEVLLKLTKSPTLKSE